MRKITASLLVLGAVVILAAGCATSRVVVADSLMFDAATAWDQQTPSHPSRRLQFRLPPDDPNVAEAELVVWNFPGMRDEGDGHLIRKTMDRWCAQMVQDDGASSREVAARAEYRVNGMPMWTMDLSGRYAAETSPGSDLHYDKQGYRMLGAYIVAPEGDYLVKLVGPASVVDRYVPSFDRFLQSVRPCDPSLMNRNSAWSDQSKTQLTAVRD